jgi:hypothetical protein
VDASIARFQRGEEIERNPMEGAQAPIVPEQPVEVIEFEQLRALIDGCKGQGRRGRATPFGQATIPVRASAHRFDCERQMSHRPLARVAACVF